MGCAALHLSWDDLAEIKSVAVERSKQRKGIGKDLVEACLDEAVRLGVGRIFVLTNKPRYFKKFGFMKVKNSELPHKIWAECINCCKFPNCKEIAMVKVL